MNLIDSFYQKVEEGKKGNNMGIPSGFPKLISIYMVYKEGL